MEDFILLIFMQVRAILIHLFAIRKMDFITKINTAHFNERLYKNHKICLYNLEC